MTNSPFRQDLSLLLMRAIVGVVFTYHGMQKLFGVFGGAGLEGTADYLDGIGIPLPMASACLLGAAEFLGGLALVTGGFMQLMTVPLTFAMVIASFVAHAGQFGGPRGMEYPLTLAIVTACLGMLGPGRFAWQIGRGQSS